MNEKLDKLRELGAQKIYEDTHIPIEHVQAIIHESFESFSKVQFLGFLSILEREYGQDLSSLRESGVKFFTEKDISKSKDILFITPKNNYTLLYVVVVVIVFLLAFYFNADSSKEAQKTQTTLIDNTIIEDAQKNIDPLDLNESNVSAESNVSIESNAELNTTQVEENVVVPTLSITTKTKVWIGYIELQTNIHYQKIFTSELELDPSKDWLLVLGHSFIDIVVNGEVQEFSTARNVRFLYKNGKVEPITSEEFKRYNKGRLW
jgi:hypothetical protein